MDIKSNYEWLFEILNKSAGGTEEDIVIEKNTFVDMGTVIQQITVKTEENGGTIAPSGGGGGEGAYPPVDDYTPIEGEFAYIRSMENNNVVYFNNPDYRITGWLGYLDYSYNQVDWRPATELTTVKLKKNQKIYFKNNGTGVIPSKVSKNGTFAADKYFAIGGDFGKFTSNNNTQFNLDKFFAKSSSGELQKLVKVDNYCDFGNTKGGVEVFDGNDLIYEFFGNITLASGENAFRKNKNLRSVNKFNDASTLTSMFGMFEKCEVLESIYEIPSRITNIAQAFEYTYLLQEVYLDNLTLSGMRRAFNESGLQRINGNFSTKNCKHLNHTFCRARKVCGTYTFDLSSLNSGESYASLDFMFHQAGADNDEGLYITFTNVPSGLTRIGTQIFSDSNIKRLDGDLSNFSSVESFHYFLWNTKLEEYNNTLNVSSAKDLKSFLGFCRNLDCDTLPNEMSTHNATDFTNMFRNVGENNKPMVTAPILHTENGKKFDSTFEECYSLETVPLINFSNATTASNTFNSCSNLKNITFEGSINCDLNLYSSQLTYATIKSALTAASLATAGHKLKFGGSSVTDNGGEIMNLVNTCVANGWTISNLVIN